MSEYWDKIVGEQSRQQAEEQQLAEEKRKVAEVESAKRAVEQEIEKVRVIKEAAARDKAYSIVKRILGEVLENSKDINSSSYCEIVQSAQSIKLQWGNKREISEFEATVLSKYDFRKFDEEDVYSQIFIYLFLLGLIVWTGMTSRLHYLFWAILFIAPLLAHAIHKARRYKAIPGIILESDYKFIEIQIRDLTIEGIPILDFIANPDSIIPAIAMKLKNPIPVIGKSLIRGQDYWKTPPVVSCEDGGG